MNDYKDAIYGDDSWWPRVNTDAVVGIFAVAVTGGSVATAFSAPLPWLWRAVLIAGTVLAVALAFVGFALRTRHRPVVAPTLAAVLAEGRALVDEGWVEVQGGEYDHWNIADLGVPIRWRYGRAAPCDDHRCIVNAFCTPRPHYHARQVMWVPLWAGPFLGALAPLAHRLDRDELVRVIAALRVREDMRALCALAGPAAVWCALVGEAAANTRETAAP